MSDWFPFQEVPGLLTPEQSSNVRMRSLLGAAAGLIRGGGASALPKTPFEALGEGLEGGLKGYDDGQQHAVRQMLLREQAQKLMDARTQAAQWQQLFGGAGVAPGLLTTPTQAPGPIASPTPPGGLLTPTSAGARPPVPSSAKVWGDTEAEAAGLYSPAPAPAGAPLSSGPTQRDVRAQASAGGIQEVVAQMPVGVRQMIAVLGPEKGKEVLAGWVGKKAEKPSDTFITVKSGGEMKPYRADSAELDAALRMPGAMVVTTPSANEHKSSNTMVTLRLADGTDKTFRAADPAVDRELANGAMQVTTKSSSEHKSSNTMTTVRMPDGSIQTMRAADPAVDAALKAGGLVVTTPSSDPKDHKPDNYALPNGDTVLSTDGKSFVHPVTKRTMQLPSDAIRLGADTAYTAARENKVRGRAQNDLETRPAPAQRPAAEDPTLIGTGLWSAVQSITNSAAGGVGVDYLLGKKGFFADNEANRNYLVNLRQVAKTALVNNPRFPVAEQKNVDRMFPDPDSMWTNPRTEAQKVVLLRNTLEEQLTMNNEAIASGGLAKEEMSRLTSNNIETRRALRLLGHGDSTLKVLGDGPTRYDRNGSRASTAAKPASVDFSARWGTVPADTIVIQGGRKYRKNADGTAEQIR